MLGRRAAEPGAAGALSGLPDAGPQRLGGDAGADARDLRRRDLRVQRLGWNYFRSPDGDPIDKPSSLAGQLVWMAEAGFVGVDCNWLAAGHTNFSGRKA